jgi:hypothetical protein
MIVAEVVDLGISIPAITDHGYSIPCSYAPLPLFLRNRALMHSSLSSQNAFIGDPGQRYLPPKGICRF